MAPNPTYSGPVKPTLDQVRGAAVHRRRRRVQRPGRAARSTSATCPLAGRDQGRRRTRSWPAANNPRLSDFYLAPLYTLGDQLLPRTTSTPPGTTATPGKIFRQLYFRQAFQNLVDQPLYINKIDKGYGVPTYGPVPVAAGRTPSSSQVEKTNPYPYSLSKAKSLLSSHGWKVVPGGTDHLHRPGHRRQPVRRRHPRRGASSTFNLQYASGNSHPDQLMNDREVVVGPGRVSTST